MLLHNIPALHDTLLDATGNWDNFKQDDDGDGTWNLDQERTANPVNEITGITETTGPSWAPPAYDPAGNMTTLPQPADPTANYGAVYDAWNRLVKLAEGANTAQENAYDGLRRRTVRKDFAGGSLDETRHFYYSAAWQVLEERLNASTNPDWQFVWGVRYIDDLALRGRDTNADGTLDERLYALQDTNWNVVALANTTGDMQERYAYQPYGEPLFLNAAFVPQSTSGFDWETFFCGYRYNSRTGLYLVRNRVLHPAVGTWVQRDPIGYADGMSLYAAYFVLGWMDPSGLGWNLDPGGSGWSAGGISPWGTDLFPGAYSSPRPQAPPAVTANGSLHIDIRWEAPKNFFLATDPDRDNRYKEHYKLSRDRAIKIYRDMAKGLRKALARCCKTHRICFCSKPEVTFKLKPIEKTYRDTLSAHVDLRDDQRTNVVIFTGSYPGNPYVAGAAQPHISSGVLINATVAGPFTLAHELGHIGGYEAPAGEAHIGEGGGIDPNHSRVPHNVMATEKTRTSFDDDWSVDKNWCRAIQLLTEHQN